MSKNSINIDGAKLRSLIEATTGKTIYEVALDSGYSKNILSEAIRKGIASPTVQNLTRLYGIDPSAYEVKPVETATKDATSDRQLTIDDLISTDARDILKAVVKEAIIETISSISTKEIMTSYDPLTMTYNASIRIKKEALSSNNDRFNI